MTDTVDTVIQTAFDVTRNVAGPMFTERGFFDVAERFNGATSLGGLLEAFDFAETVCTCPPVVMAALHDMRTAFERIKQVKDAGGMDFNKLGFARLQILHAASLFQDARNGKIGFD